jgi:hypothetical protein
LAVATFALLLVAVVTAASDEGGLTWGERAGRTLPIAPVCAAIGAWVALLPGRARGDDRALAALGRSTWERHAAAIVGGGIVPLGAAVLVGAVHRVDIRGFYPRAEESLTWNHDASGFVSGDGRWRVAPGGAPTRVEPPATAQANEAAPAELASAVPDGGRLSAALATAFAGLALPMLVARSSSRRRAASAIASMGVAAIATVLAFQAAAASRVPAAVALLPPLFLLVWAASRYRSSPWSRVKSPR